MLIIGLDLSFSSTGITVINFENNVAKSIQFHRVIYDENKQKTDKVYKPTKLSKINNLTYRLPTNILAEDLIMNDEDENNIEQAEATLKALICSKKIGTVIQSAIRQYRPDEVIFSIENYIMPAFSGQNQLKVVSGLIMLQGFVREISIRLSIELGFAIRLFTPTATSNKKFFTGDGRAQKDKMLHTFINIYDGQKLIPEAHISKLHMINDVVDSFALACQAFHIYLNYGRFVIKDDICFQ